mgnify:FL=1
MRDKTIIHTNVTALTNDTLQQALPALRWTIPLLAQCCLFISPAPAATASEPATIIPVEKDRARHDAYVRVRARIASISPLRRGP